MTTHEYTLHRLGDTYAALIMRIDVPPMFSETAQWEFAAARWMLSDDHSAVEAMVLRAMGHVIHAGLHGHIATGQLEAVRQLLSAQPWYDALLVALDESA